MKKKINVLIVTLIIYLTAIVIVPNNTVKATEPEIDTDYIKTVAEKLSWAIFDTDWPTELEKGRAFGTEGEHYAANYLADEMKYNLSLYDPTGNTDKPYHDKITDKRHPLRVIYGNEELTTEDFEMLVIADFTSEI